MCCRFMRGTFLFKIQFQTSSNFVLREFMYLHILSNIHAVKFKKKSLQIKFYIKCDENKKGEKVVNLLKSREIDTGLCI